MHGCTGRQGFRDSWGQTTRTNGGRSVRETDVRARAPHGAYGVISGVIDAVCTATVRCRAGSVAVLCSHTCEIATRPLTMFVRSYFAFLVSPRVPRTSCLTDFHSPVPPVLSISRCCRLRAGSVTAPCTRAPRPADLDLARRSLPWSTERITYDTLQCSCTQLVQPSADAMLPRPVVLVAHAFL